MSEPETSDAKVQDTGWLSVAAIVLFVMLLLATLADVGGRVSQTPVTSSNWRDILHSFGKALLVNLPNFIFLGVLADFSDLFRRTGEGEVFTARNLRTLRNAGQGLIYAAVASALVVPSALMWIDGEHGGFIWHVNDLAFGTFAMGFALLGFCRIFAEGIRIKTDSDQII